MKMDGVTVQHRFVIRRHPQRGEHPNWRIVDTKTDELVCVCAYLKGAEALVERIVRYEDELARLKTLETNEAI